MQLGEGEEDHLIFLCHIMFIDRFEISVPPDSQPNFVHVSRAMLLFEVYDSNPGFRRLGNFISLFPRHFPFKLFFLHPATFPDAL